MFGFENLGFDFDVSPDIDVSSDGYQWGDWGEKTDGVSTGGDTGYTGADGDYDGSDYVFGGDQQAAGGAFATKASSAQQSGSNGPSTFDKVMQTLEKNPKLAAAVIQGAGGLIAGAGAGYAAQKKQEFEDKKIQEAWERRRMEAKPGTVRKENWGGLVAAAGK